MNTPIPILLISVLLSSLPLFSISSRPHDTLLAPFSLSISDVLTSPNKVFSAGFHSVGKNAYSFSIWFTKPTSDGNLTIVWTANRDQPVNGKHSKLSLLKSGNLILTDASQFTVWSTDTKSISPLELLLLNTGNLILKNPKSSISSVWESFDSPTDTLLPNQTLTQNSKLVSSRSHSNFSSGYYTLFFNYDNVLRLLFDSPDISSIYWPDPWKNIWEAGRTSYYTRKSKAAFNSSGYFKSSDDFAFKALDYGVVGVWRRLKMDVDGNVRMYSLDEKSMIWSVSWQVIQQPCQIHGVCGPNTICNYDFPGENAGRRCSCLPGYKAKSVTDWSLGCELALNFSCDTTESSFIKLAHVQFVGEDLQFYKNYTLERCEKVCLERCNCSGFTYPFVDGHYNCYLKSLFLNGYRSPGFQDSSYIRLPKSYRTSDVNRKQEVRLQCPRTHNLPLNRVYKKPKQNGTLQFMVWFAVAFGGVEIICVCFVWLFLYKTQQSSSENTQGYLQVASGFRRFTYDELKKASGNFTEEIGRGGGGVVYKGILSDRRVAAIKRLNEANKGEAEFLAEVSTIGRVNHMNLIEIWGYCVEGNHRLLVYEYMERGSLAENLSSNSLDWEKRFDIAVGSAKGLAYLHEECLEWVLHCDVKPQNILLDSNFHPKVADFGLSKLVNRGGDGKNSSFSKVRGTRGYMAPEWISNLPITSKVDVYSYGMVVLGIVTGKSPMTTGGQVSENTREMEQRGLVKWVREKINGDGGKELWLEEIIDPVMKENCDLNKMKILVQVALQCVEEDRDARPTMRQVTAKLLHKENDDY